MKPKISVFTSCYRPKRQHLENYLLSLTNQTIRDQIQVVFDHNEPTKEENELLANFEQSYPGLIKRQIRESVVPLGDSWNQCIKNADAPYMALWNVDDQRTYDSLQRQLSLFVKGYEVVHGNFVIINDPNTFKGKIVDHLNRTDYEESMILGPFFAFERKLCNEIGYFDEQLKCALDYDFAIRLAKHCGVNNIGMTREILGYFLDEQQGLSTSNNNLQQIERTVVELRYGLEHKIENQFRDKLRNTNYDPSTIVEFGKERTL